MLIGMSVLFFVSLFVCLLHIIFSISKDRMKERNSIPKCRYKLELDDSIYYGDEYSIDGDFIKFHALAHCYLWGGAFSGIHMDFEPCDKTIEITKYALERNENGFDFNAMKY
ncbi:hypothetical protein A8F04_35990 [Burkholderia cenocepacia]|nr:hypothetical protein A8D82_28490 [Burkholderia cenocepacia]ONN78871.1 hypothetical protein A8D63_35005 [Burkholderia cenocepacia]ONN81816.1 hypothetical protein A8D62_30725 [Burkholderia cenocepacia]ONO14235.1 hypothetical protein A8D67_05960 [Burkholderia cenocepacia]ONO37326.1 hypothetical protein A8D66_11950 [Burkholderia cenocepacia]